MRLQIAQQIKLAKTRPELFVPPLQEGPRSPSPPPQYDEAGVRINTRALRAVEKLAEQAQVQRCNRQLLLRPQQAQLLAMSALLTAYKPFCKWQATQQKVVLTRP